MPQDIGLEIRPRYEFRVWEPRLDDVRAALRSSSECVETRRCTETYFLARADTGANPKVRRGALDVKVLVDRRDDFELWERRLKELFPIRARVAEVVLFDWLGAPRQELTRDSYTLPELLEEVVSVVEDVTTVDVSKTREAYALEGCLAEFVEVSIGGRELQTASVESTEIPRLERARRLLDLDGRPNTSYPAAIKALIGW